MGNAFDFRIKQPTYVEALDIYERLEKLLDFEKEKQLEKIAVLGQRTTGLTRDAMMEETRQFLEYGNYAKAYEQVKKLRKGMEEALPEINALLARCEGFVEQFRSDAYVEPLRPAAGNNAVRNGGILALDYSKIAVIKDLCDEISEENRKLKIRLNSVISSYNRGVPGADEIAALNAASAKLDRVQNFKTSFQKYEAGVRALEFDLVLHMSAVSANAEETGAECGISATERITQIQDLSDRYNPLYTGEKELDGLMKQFLEEQNDEAMLVVAQGIFAQPYTDWSEAESNFIAQTFDYAMQNQKIEMIELYVEGLMKGTYSEPAIWHVTQHNHSDSITYKSDYIVSGRQAEISSVMNCLSVTQQGETYYTLNRLMKTSISGVEIKTTDKQELHGGAFDVEVKLVDGEIKIVFSAGQEKEDTMEVETRCEMTVFDMGELSVTRLHKDLHYTPVQIQEMRMGVVTDADIKMMAEICAGDYKEAFDVPLEQLSSNMKMNLAYFGIHLCGLMDEGDAGQQEAELQKFVNGMLYTDEERCIYGEYHYFPEDYLRELTAYTGFVRDIYTATILNGYEEGDSAKAYSRNINSMYSFWYSLYEMMSEDANKNNYETDLWYTRGECVVQLSDLIKDDTTMGYTFGLYPSKGERTDLKTILVTTEVAVTPLETIGAYGRAKSKEIEEEIEMLWMSCTVDTLIGAIVAYSPTKGSVLRAAVHQLDGCSASDLLSDSVKIPEIKKRLGKNGIASLSVLQNILSYCEEKQQLESAKEAQDKENMLPWLYSANKYSVGGTTQNDVYISDGIYDYNVLRGIRIWNESGIGPMLIKEDAVNESGKSLYEGKTEEQMQEIYQLKNANVLKKLEEHINYNFYEEPAEIRNAVLFLIFGREAENQQGWYGDDYTYTSVLQIPDATFIDAVDIINDVINEETSDFGKDPKTLQLWNNMIVGVE